jgi:hypothetical protein
MYYTLKIKDPATFRVFGVTAGFVVVQLLGLRPGSFEPLYDVFEPLKTGKLLGLSAQELSTVTRQGFYF